MEEGVCRVRLGRILRETRAVAALVSAAAARCGGDGVQPRRSRRRLRRASSGRATLAGAIYPGWGAVPVSGSAMFVKWNASISSATGFDTVTGLPNNPGSSTFARSAVSRSRALR
jgi:hypothetical protein